MNRFSLVRSCSLFLVSLLIIPLAHAAQPGYYRFPSIHGDQVVFNCEGDLWKAPVAGGLATRLTSHPGNESLAHFSPDGKWIAFTADYFSAGDVYIIPADGGEPKQLTYHPVTDSVVGWTPDSSAVLFRARRSGLDSDDSLYKVPITGGDPELVKVGLATYASYSPDATKIAFNRFGWNGTWKRYQGGTSPKIWLGDLSAGKFTQITNGNFVDQFPMWAGDRIFFTSERAGTVNLFSCKTDGSDVKQATSHNVYDIRTPDSDGKQVVYSMAGDLYVYDIANAADTKINVDLPSDRIRQRPRVEDASKTLDAYDLNDDGKKLVVTSRGQVWTTGVKPGGRIISLTDNTSGIRRRGATHSPDGKQVAAITDETGEQEIVLFDADGKGAPKILTHRNAGWLFGPKWAPDGKHLVYGEMTGTLVLVDVTTGEVKEVDTDKNSEITDYSFSPDGQWIAYTKVGNNRVQTISLYSLADSKITSISGGFTSDFSPVWDPSGKFLYFLSNRNFNPYLDDLDRVFMVTKTVKICVCMLNKDAKSPFLPDELQDEEDDKDKQADKDDATTKSSDDTTSKPAEGKKKDKKKELPKVVIDLDGIGNRVEEFPIEAGNYRQLAAIEKKLFYVSTPIQGMAEAPAGLGAEPEPRGALHAYDLKKKKDEVYLPAVKAYVVSGDGKKIAFTKGKDILVAGTDTKPGDDLEEKLTLSTLPLAVSTADEWKQIYTDAWRLQRDFYWASNMANIDWPAMRKKYEPLVAKVSTRGELNDIIGQLIGELGTSHTYVYGGDSSYNPPTPAAVGVLGADVELDGASKLHRFVKVYRGETWETDIDAPLSRANANVHEGDYLIAINGHELKADESIDQRLANLAEAQVQLTVASKSDKSDARDIQIEAMRSDADLRYHDWCRRNREYVDQKSGGKIGYFHLPDMQGDGLVQFVKGFYPQFNKDGLIIDVRDNHGGFVSQMLIERLSRQVLAYDQPRRGLTSTYPEVAHAGYKVCLINQHSGSDGDIFPDSFRTKGLGPLIGKRTWGGVVGIRGDKNFIDNGGSSQPEFAWWDARRGWSIENHGVDPDLEVDNTPEDQIAGKDAQLDRGIAELLKMMDAKPVAHPQHPPYPDKSGRK